MWRLRKVKMEENKIYRVRQNRLMKRGFNSWRVLLKIESWLKWDSSKKKNLIKSLVLKKKATNKKLRKRIMRRLKIN